MVNKEEIEKEDKEHLIKVLTEYKDYIFEFNNDNIKIEYILDYIRELEFQNTALKAEHYHNVDRIEELVEKESILDKVTDYIKMYIDDKQNEYEAISESYICQTDEDEYLKEKKLAIIKGKKQVLKNALNIIEGGKKQ